MKNMTKNYYQHFMCSCKTFLRKLLIESKKKSFNFYLDQKIQTGKKILQKSKNYFFFFSDENFSFLFEIFFGEKFFFYLKKFPNKKKKFPTKNVLPTKKITLIQNFPGGRKKMKLIVKISKNKNQN